jgi:methylmalonyl-CoA/ethylmalonyl-CoA epimerase
MLKAKRIDHVAVCVDDVDQAAPLWEKLLGRPAGAREIVESQKTEAAFFTVGAGETGLELIAPRGNPSLERFLAKRGSSALHHVAVEVEDIDAALAFLASLGVPLIDAAARPGARGHRVAFVHPKATGGVLVELVERK